jgi:hypothetical protein
LLLPPPRQKELANSKYVTKDKKYVGLLNIVLIDCNLRADKAQYTKHDLMHVVQEYNRCKGKVVNKREEFKIKVGYRVFSGLNVSNVDASENSGFPFENKNSSSFVYGGGIDFSSLSISKDFFVTLEVSYIGRKYGKSYAYSGDTYWGTDEWSMTFKSLRFPFGFRYNILGEQHSFYLTAGLVKYAVLKAESIFTSKRVENGVTQTSQTRHDLDSKSPGGFWFGFGYNRAIGPKTKIFFELRAENVKGYYENTTIWGADMLVGVRF